jgi:hypothetical protein
MFLRKNQVYCQRNKKRTCWCMATRGDLLAHSISFALIGARKAVRGLWATLTEAERWAVASRAVAALKEHGDKWKLNEEMEANPLDGAHSSPHSFTEAHDYKKDEQS